jgi:hypothetical protein
VCLILFSMHFSLGHQFVVRKIQRSWWCRRSFRSWCLALRCACTLLHSYNCNNFRRRNIRAVGIVSKQAGPVFCSIPPVKSRVTCLSAQTSSTVFQQKDLACLHIIVFNSCGCAMLNSPEWLIPVLQAAVLLSKHIRVAGRQPLYSLLYFFRS